jgi:hypothetical protein
MRMPANLVEVTTVHLRLQYGVTYFHRIHQTWKESVRLCHNTSGEKKTMHNIKTIRYSLGCPFSTLDDLLEQAEEEIQLRRGQRVGGDDQNQNQGDEDRLF